MALSTPFVGSGHFVPERVWSCPNHEDPVEHYCDCGFCTWEQPDCCASAAWIDKLDADGNVIKRELSETEAAFQRIFLEKTKEDLTYHEAFVAALQGSPSRTYVWVEDDSRGSVAP